VPFSLKAFGYRELNRVEMAERPDLFARDIVKVWFYMLRLRSGALYPGATKNLEERYKAPVAGKACRTTKFDPPVGLVYSEELDTFSEARKREAQIKRWSRPKKEALVSGDLYTLRELSKSRKH
jgi:putative endonuclease